MNCRHQKIIARTALLFAACGTLTATAIAQNPPATTTTGDSADHQREGSRLVAAQGHFRATGDRLTFHLREGELEYPCLENLSLERITKIVSDRHDDSEQSVWEVTGTFTEYRGSNYLLITHAVLKNKTRRRAALP